MNKVPLNRKLAVILHADVVGSTALVQRNETLAHQRMQAAFHYFSMTIASFGGNTREIHGDALVAEFERASDAVAAETLADARPGQPEHDARRAARRRITRVVQIDESYRING
ncbi:MAG: hypothetical protein ACO3DT_03745 [Gammaproteobacteria bacterium]